MRHARAASPLGLFALLVAAVAIAACGGGSEQATPSADSAVAAAPPPPPESFAVTGKDDSWTVDITPANIVWHKVKGRKDSIVFDFKAPTIDGAIHEYESILTAPDTHTIHVTLSMVPCADNSKKEYTHQAQVWVDRVAYSGCAVKK